MTKMVAVKGMDLVGKVIDSNAKYVTIETADDVYIFAADKVVEYAAPVELNEFEAAMEKAEIAFDGYTDGDNLTYMIEGFTYTIDCYLDFESGIFSLETKHKGIEREDEKSWANKVEYKKLSTLIKNVIKWADK
jgi:hypothetical protein